MATDNISRGLLKLFSTFSFQCGDTACTWPKETCNRDREPFTVCNGASTMTYLQSNFDEHFKSLCRNFTEEIQPTNSNSYAYLFYGSITLNIGLLLLTMCLIICFVRMNRQKHITSKQTESENQVKKPGNSSTMYLNSEEKTWNNMHPSGRQLIHIGTSQASESLIHIIATKTHKAKHFGGSESLDNTVAAGVAQLNGGRKYAVDITENHGLSPGKVAVAKSIKLGEKAKRNGEKTKLPAVKRKRKSKKSNSFLNTVKISPLKPSG
ncbi:unnamed protein product [Mytilus coruscus]|uniref:Uncharacterized protein n=1 Tax=Mytilus coruscus TaxID=42192 RepID=A0A6J8ASZ4_MYTCO|nr:unnamed protein product [Mytilus coruscus]